MTQADIGPDHPAADHPAADHPAAAHRQDELGARVEDPLDGLRVVADDTITAGGTSPDDGRHLVDVDHRAAMAGESEPNGWFAGPYTDPDRFELLGRGLSGGEGNTWRARYQGQLTSPLTLAVKELRRPPHAPAEWPTDEDVRRWEDQRALLQYMRIDHLVTVIDIFVGPPPHLPGPSRRRVPETPYLVMEWVSGPTLADELSGVAARPETIDARLAHVQHVAEALHALHSRTASAGNPTLHRDVKPTNCILDPRRGVVLVDVGTMRRVDDGYDHAGFHTPAYTAPEVLQNPHAPRAASSDLYSLGALAYFCVLGEDPPKPDQPEVWAEMETRLLAAARAAGVADGRGFVSHLRLMLDPSSGSRPADAMSWARRLRALAAPRQHRVPFARHLSATSLHVAVVAVLAVLATLAVVMLRSGDDANRGVPAGQAGQGVAGGGAGAAPGQPGGAAFNPPPGPPPGFPGGPTLPPGGKYGPPPGSPDGTRPEIIGTPGPNGTIVSEIAAITSPGSQTSVNQCLEVTGTSRLPGGQTLMLSVENLSFQDGVKHLQPVQGWQRPAKLAHWRGRQFAGRPEDPPGQSYRLEVFIVPLATLKRQAPKVDDPGPGWGTAMPKGAKVVAALIVTRAPDRPAC